MRTIPSTRARAIAAPLGAVLPFVLVAAAHAQGNGVRSGRFRVHPEARFEARFDNNLYREDAQEESPVAAGYLRLMPSLRLTNPAPGPVSVDGSAGLEIRQYLESRINDQQDALGVGLAAGATIGQGQGFELAINQDLRRQLEVGQGVDQQPGTAEPQVEEVDCASPCTFTFWRNVTRLQGRFAPGGGRLVFAPGYKFTLTRFEEFDTIDKDEHELRAGGSYRFFPRTSFVIDGAYQIIDYTAKQLVGDISPVRVQAGLRGLVTTKLAVVLTGGYGSTLTSAKGEQPDDDFAGFIGTAELIYELTQGLRARLSYDRDFADSSFSNFVAVDRVGGKLEARLGGNFNATAEFYASFRGYSEGRVVDGVSVSAAQLSSREDTFLVGDLAGSYHANDWLVVTGGYRLEQNNTEYGSAVGAARNFAAFARHQIFLGLALLL